MRGSCPAIRAVRAPPTNAASALHPRLVARYAGGRGTPGVAVARIPPGTIRWAATAVVIITMRAIAAKPPRTARKLWITMGLGRGC